MTRRTLFVGCHYHGVTYTDGQVLPGGEGGCQDCTCSVRRGCFWFGASPFAIIIHVMCVIHFHREVKRCVHGGDARRLHAHTQLWMAVSVECVTAVAFTDAAASTESDSPTLLTAVSSAPVWYQHALI